MFLVCVMEPSGVQFDQGDHTEIEQSTGNLFFKALRRFEGTINGDEAASLSRAVTMADNLAWVA